MKIVHVTSTSSGGAATAAIRQHVALLEYGYNSKIIFLHRYSANIPHSILIDQKIPIWRRLAHRLNFLSYYNDKLNEVKRLITSSYEIISLPYSDYHIERLPDIIKADIINLHWPTGLLNYSHFFDQIHKPIVWTLHDMNALLGIFHYSLDEKILHNNQRLKTIDESAKQTKRAALLNAHNLTFVCPSNWMLEETLQIDEFRKNKKAHIPYCIDNRIFRPYNKQEVRKEFGLPIDKNILLFVTESIQNKRKGFDILLEALKRIKNNSYFLCAIGDLPNENIALKESNVKFFGKINDEHFLAKLYSAADCFILPSIQDNLPNVMIESLSCGTPVISFSVGGMKDVIKTGVNGIQVNEVNPEALSDAIVSFLKSTESYNRNYIVNETHKLFSQKLIVDSYINLYESIKN